MNFIYYQILKPVSLRQEWHILLENIWSVDGTKVPVLLFTQFSSYIHTEKVNKVFRSSYILLGKLSSASHEFPSTNWIPNKARTVHILFSMKVVCVVDLSGRLKEGVCLFWYSLLLLFCCIDLNFDNLPMNAEVQVNA